MDLSRHDRKHLSLEYNTALIIFAVAMLDSIIGHWDYLIRESLVHLLLRLHSLTWSTTCCNALKNCNASLSSGFLAIFLHKWRIFWQEHLPNPFHPVSLSFPRGQVPSFFTFTLNYPISSLSLFANCSPYLKPLLHRNSLSINYLIVF